MFCLLACQVYIAAFAISGYAWARYRNRYKPFNPVLGETFECVREDRGFCYISEQVSTFKSGSIYLNFLVLFGVSCSSPMHADMGEGIF